MEPMRAAAEGDSGSGGSIRLPGNCVGGKAVRTWTSLFLHFRRPMWEFSCARRDIVIMVDVVLGDYAEEERK